MTASLTMPMQVFFVISPGEDGQLNAEYQPERSKFPAMEDNNVKTRLVVDGKDPKPGDDSIPIYAEFGGPAYGFTEAAAILTGQVIPPRTCNGRC